MSRLTKWTGNGTLERCTTASIVLAAILFVLTACQADPATKTEFLAIGTPPLESSALLYVAVDQGLFARNGLEVTLRNYETGAASLDGLVNGEVDIAVPAEYALVGKAFARAKVRAIASIDKAQYFFLVARRDRGIQALADLKGKKVGVVRKTIAEFYLGRLLVLHGLTLGQVTLVDVNISQSGAAISSADVDAIVSRPPYLIQIQDALGENAVVWEAQSSQALFAILIGRNDWIAAYPERVRRLFRSLLQAEEYLVRHPAQAQSIVQKRLNLGDDHMQAVWSQNQFSLSLDQSLILAMEDEARWMIANDLTAETRVPDFLKYVDENALSAVKPGAVNIIR